MRTAGLSNCIESGASGPSVRSIIDKAICVTGCTDLHRSIARKHVRSFVVFFVSGARRRRHFSSV